MGRCGCYEAIPYPARKKKRFVAQTVVLHVTPPHPSQAALTNTQKQWAKPTDICFLLSKTYQTCAQQFCMRITVPQNKTLQPYEKKSIFIHFFFFVILRHTLILQPSHNRIYCVAEVGLEFIMKYSLASHVQQQSTRPALPSLRITSASHQSLQNFVGLFFLQTEDLYQHLLMVQRCQFLQSMYSLCICLTSWKFHDFESSLLF